MYKRNQFIYNVYCLGLLLSLNLQAQHEDIERVIEDFRLGIIHLESEQQWSRLFLHDSITWAMIREGKTEIDHYEKDPHWKFFSSDPISFFRFLKAKNSEFEEKFYDVSISSSGQFSTVDFLYSFNSNGQVLNWGKEYWSLLKVKEDWKITSVTWTENSSDIEKCTFCDTKSFYLDRYRCPPCPFDCDDHFYDKPGECPVCQMSLIKVVDRAYEGYDRANFFLQNGDVQLYTAYYTPKDLDKISGALIIGHGSAPTTYEDLSFYIKIGTQLNMAILAFDKRGAGLSSGEYENFTVEGSEAWFDLLSEDLLAGLNWLKNRAELKKKPIGLIGGSQAGWIMPLAASKSDAVDFIIIGEGAAVSAGEEDYFSIQTEDGTATGKSIQEADEILKGFNGNKGFDPHQILKKINTLTLWIFGTNDPVIPVDASLRALEKMNSSNFDIEILENGDHSFVNTVTGERYDLYKIVRSWLEKIGLLKF
ncbi:prolyl oligopeptidase family serine peptidase [Muricauda sp. JGD-17]|uniref:Prolyl oligopeptidase family serine peptidase n=1 Tax=Flagellimonas ochracea TaxID=2696472 RepID=A0A964TE95_9FLAO|nr:prolyl oligopeptidase family serine peptidase [Allomuricauda ochracea]NAY93345.1 prolyl oligopeptidase family serine peptidase [Allomuricauda ochracea]